MSDRGRARDPLEFTDERFLPGMTGSIEMEHHHRYQFVTGLVAGKRVLDIACGEGYGTAMLADTAAYVVGVDISSEVVGNAQHKYRPDGIGFCVADCSSIPLADGSFDIVVSFETLEHHDRHEEMLSEIKRVLRPDGVLVISTPDKSEYSDKRAYVNPFHLKELYKHQFIELVGAYFSNQALYGQKVAYGSVILSDASGGLPLDTGTVGTPPAAEGVVAPLYWLCVASDSKVPLLPAGVLERPVEDSEAMMAARAVIADKDRFIAALGSEISRMKATVSWQITKPLRLIANLRKFMQAKKYF
jgi:protein-L-isoaspartate O-methyltransferase